MADWKDTCNLPRTTFSMKANLQATEPETVARWDEMDLYGKIRGARTGLAQVPAARRSAVRQRRDPHRPRAQQDSQGPGRQVAQHARLRRPLHPRVGLPRSANRAEGGPRARPEEEADEHGGLPPRLPGLRREVCRHPAPRLQAPGRARPVGGAVQDADVHLPGGDRPRARQVRRAGHGLQGQEAGALVHALPHCAGRGGSRVRAAYLAVGVRRIPDGARERARVLEARIRIRRSAERESLKRSVQRRTSPSSSGRRHHGRSRTTSRSRFIRTSNTARTTWTARR